MARPQKEGLDYFPLDVDMASDERVEYIEGRYGLEGFATIIHLLMAIYRNGYYLPWGEMQVYVTSKRINLPVNTLSEMINQLVNVGFFDINLYEKYGILTSHGIQARYIKACEYRKKIKMVREFCLITSADNVKESRFDYQNLPQRIKQVENPDTYGIKRVGNIEITPKYVALNCGEIPQSKVKNISTTTTTPIIPPEEKQEPMDEELAKVVQAFSDNIHPITPMEFESLQEAMQTFSAERIIEAIARAVDRGKRSMGYVRGILKSWQEEGYDNPGEVNGGKQERRSNNERGLQGTRGKNQRSKGKGEHSESFKQLLADIEEVKNRPKPWEVQRPAGE